VAEFQPVAFAVFGGKSRTDACPVGPVSVCLSRQDVEAFIRGMVPFFGTVWKAGLPFPYGMERLGSRNEDGGKA
jgi:hypothetical protein